MKKYIFISMLFIFLVIETKAQNIEVSTNIPKEIIAGHQFNINVFIDKSDVKSFARLQIDLPHGFMATEKISSNGNFKFENDKITLFWIELPVEERFNVSIQIDVAPNMLGYYVISGEFSFVENGINKSLEVYPHVITVKPKGSDSEGFNVLTVKHKADSLKNQTISCIRQEPYLSKENVVIVNLLVTKQDLNKFGKIEEHIPFGYTPETIKSKNAIFVFNKKSRTIKFMWMNLPEEPQFVVSYKLIPEKGIPERMLTITGTFSYAENKTGKTIDIVEKNIEIK
ncbi:MAG: hypothetical protein GXO79_02910 [Chlorobi bacterium]|nr:hypothetical protein [Chlorobiota bacterium]